ncbi:MAG: hypothetical protein ABIR32_12535 [Ilumatobacteraceae bacterium]
MTDEPLNPPAELASAAFDGETTAAERAVVAASSPLGDEVSFYRDLRDRMTEVGVPAAARESAITAALAIFDQIQAGTEDLDAAAAAPDQSWTDASSAVSPTPVTPRTAVVVSLHQRRSRQMRWLGGAVAAAFVGVFAVAAINGSSGSDDTAASSATDSTTFSVSATDQAAKSAPAPEPAMVSESAEPMAGDAPGSETQNSGAQDSASGGFQENFSEAANDPSALYVLARSAVLDSAGDVRSFIESNEFSDSALSSSAPGAATTAAPATTAATADTTAAPLDTAATGGAEAFPLGRACVSDSPGRSAPALYRGAPVFVLVDPANTTATIIDAATCAVITNLDL